MASNETPGLGGVPGIGAPQRRAPKAWQGMMEGFFVRVPQELTRSRRNRLALRKLRR
jgi:hypothetical protein